VRYLDSSVVLAELFVERRRPPDHFWSGSLVTSRLLEYEVWTQIHAKHVGESRVEDVRFLLQRLNMLDMDPPILSRALDPFPKPIRTLDAIHLASADFLRGQGQEVSIATYDTRMGDVAREMGFELYPLD
jgi:predicted nucleic acid-binding protein